MPAPNDVNLRLQLGLAVNPPAFPLDMNTDKPPQAWRGASLTIDVAVFDQAGGSVDLGDLDYLEFDIFPILGNPQVPDSEWTYNPYSVTPFPSLPPAPLLFVTVEAADIEDSVEFSEWQAGNAKQARAVFTWAQTAQLDLGGRPSRKFWLVIHGQTTTGRRIAYAGCPLEVFETGERGIYLPNNLAPLVVPADTILYVGPNQQMPFSLPITIEGQVVVDGGILVQT